MGPEPATDDDGPNRDAIAAELAVLRGRLRGDVEALDDLDNELEAARAGLRGPSTLDQIATGFGLSPFERAVLLLAAGPELVGDVVAELVEACGVPYLTFAGALAALPSAHWSAMTPAAPLRRWALVRPLDPSSPSRSALVVDERVLHHIAGAGYIDERLAAISRPIPPLEQLPTTLALAAESLVAAWQADRPAVVHGPQRSNALLVIAEAAARTGLQGRVVAASDLLGQAGERDRTLRRMERETVLAGVAWAVDLTSARPDDATDTAHALAGLDAPLAIVGGSAETDRPRGAVEVVVGRLAVSERRAALSAALRRAGCSVPDEDADVAAGVFDLSLDGVDAAARDVAGGGNLWEVCRRLSRSSLGSLATVIPARACWDDLVLPESLLTQLRALVAAVRHRSIVLDDWGFAARTSRGLGTTALFAGPSGTGKTMAAEVIAGDLGLDLVQIDLSQVVSKWIGETEKQLGRVFDAAEDGGAVLLFDEADTLFGKRSAIRDSHDRYANLEVGYLLQRMEAFRGLAVLTTNARSALDPAFTRRLQSVVTFPYPDRALRESLWTRAFPASTPLGPLDPNDLALIDVPGGGISSIALTAAYLAAEDGSVEDSHVRTAARWELAKTGRSQPRGTGNGASIRGAGDAR